MNDQRRAPGLLLALVILMGVLLQAEMLRIDVRFHPDEALFAAQARLVTEGDLLLRTTDLDKPPLPFYATAAAFTLFGDGETAARLPNVLFSAPTLIALAALAHALYRDTAVTVLAVLLMALSPYNLAFSATVFTDIQATLWIVAAAALAARDRWAWAG
ncbi:MAG TPA: glycosyltransferase family 39 protein, partial [Aggregatilinea sp.]|uniref:ArnT family glycosyltransferase n=1 Tax=Aggregatilinea sp. TaxID=2806333 RepID=UPI002CAA7F4C